MMRPIVIACALSFGAAAGVAQDEDYLRWTAERASQTAEGACMDGRSDPARCCSGLAGTAGS